ncbi:MAG: tRNA epoxyqueuosine(34) reductase QueG [Bacteroidetes bacterium]|nr:MAG: tRNA epoxyqueuosine(34) reductase QueG [Bacteroidota bacterium]REK36349.1 MAG: tRNA epoxyqueuosine(34) reductase QueG [Bacteroidota bacterium]REK50985.1 MAG: tRNA epoxyqueuosine(34) reductase QueG [Bacteroidota bacterium]
MYDRQNASKIVKDEAYRLGFDYCGISKAGFLEEEAPRLEQWLLKNMHGRMSYMENYFDKRLDPTLLVPGAKSVISLMYNYYPVQKQKEPDAPKISKYAFGKDYHLVIKEKLKVFMDSLRQKFGQIEGRAFVDSAPVLEKAWARKSGIGWIGKNSNLINTKSGSFFFLAELIVDIELLADGPIEDYCGTCTRCIDACPTDAIIKPYVVDGSKCISYFTIELKDEIPKGYEEQFENWVFGCDICQDVCPWNRFSKAHNENQFIARDELLEMNADEWHEMNEVLFKDLFKHSAVKRSGYKGLKRNLKYIRKIS